MLPAAVLLAQIESSVSFSTALYFGGNVILVTILGEKSKADKRLLWEGYCICPVQSTHDLWDFIGCMNS